MPVPNYQALMPPLLRLCADRKEHSLAEAIAWMTRELALSEADVAETLPNSGQGKLANRVGWAKSYLKQAGLLEIPRRGYFRLTDRGAQTLASPEVVIDAKYLERFPEFQEFRSRSRQKSDAAQDFAGTDGAVSDTPQELIESGYLQIRTALAEELLQQVRAASPAFFERMVVELLLRMGYGGTRKDAGQVVGKSGDGGIDGVIKEDRLGLDVIYIQAKRWASDVGSAEMRDFIGALSVNRARKGVFITTSGYGKGAREAAAKIDSKIVLIDGPMLAELMLDFGLGVSPVSTYEIKRLDSDYFEED